MPDWYSPTWAVLGLVWWRALLGVALLIFACVAGWQISVSASLAPVRFVRWWVLRVLLPLLRSRSWVGRAAAIYANNMAILTAVVAVAAWSWAVILGIAVIGGAMGIAVRTLSQEPSMASLEVDPADTGTPGRVIWGMVLNLLEPPAIAITLGLALSYTSAPLTDTQLWRTFGLVVAPLMLVAAGGESLWMGATDAFAGPPADQTQEHRPGIKTGDDDHDGDCMAG